MCFCLQAIQDGKLALIRKIRNKGQICRSLCLRFSSMPIWIRLTCVVSWQPYMSYVLFCLHLSDVFCVQVPSLKGARDVPEPAVWRLGEYGRHHAEEELWEKSSLVIGGDCWPINGLFWVPSYSWRVWPKPFLSIVGSSLSFNPKNCADEEICLWHPWYTSSTAQGGGGSFKNRKPIGEIGCCESGMAEWIHWWTERCLRSPLFLSLSLTIYPPTKLSSMYLSVCLSIYLSVYLSTCLSVVQCHSV